MRASTFRSLGKGKRGKERGKRKIELSRLGSLEAWKRGSVEAVPIQLMDYLMDFKLLISAYIRIYSVITLMMMRILALLLLAQI